MQNDPGTTPATESDAPKTGVRKKAAKKPAKKTPVKTNGAGEGTSLAAICKTMKVEPRWARRVLRMAKGVPDASESRWTWTKAADVAKVKSILKEAAGE